jgi:hypothetical protein
MAIVPRSVSNGCPVSVSSFLRRSMTMLQRRSGDHATDRLIVPRFGYAEIWTYDSEVSRGLEIRTRSSATFRMDTVAGGVQQFLIKPMPIAQNSYLFSEWKQTNDAAKRIPVVRKALILRPLPCDRRWRVRTKLLTFDNSRKF